jgi:hypothetical protein
VVVVVASLADAALKHVQSCHTVLQAHSIESTGARVSGPSEAPRVEQAHTEIKPQTPTTTTSDLVCSPIRFLSVRKR